MSGKQGVRKTDSTIQQYSKTCIWQAIEKAKLEENKYYFLRTADKTLIKKLRKTPGVSLFGEYFYGTRLFAVQFLISYEKMKQILKIAATKV